MPLHSVFQKSSPRGGSDRHSKRGSSSPLLRIQQQQLDMSMGPLNIPHYPILKTAASRYPIIDNHAHNLLRADNPEALSLEGVASEAHGTALEDTKTSLASLRTVIQLSELYGSEPRWQAVKAARNSIPYEELCRKCFERTGIACLLLDDLLDNNTRLCYDYKWHDKFTQQPTKRILRVEVVAEELIKALYNKRRITVSTFITEFNEILGKYCDDDEVVGFKSIICYRTGLNIATHAGTIDQLDKELQCVLDELEETGRIRLASKGLNDFIVLTTLNYAGLCKKPVQFHTGLGDNDISLTTANPSVMQPVINAYPQTTIVLLHSSYPFCREAGYLASVYKNVYLDFGEVFPMVSYDGQLSIIRQVLEMTPTNKLLWSTDGHWWPESYYLAVIQAREAIYEVLSHSVARNHLTEAQAVQIVANIFYHNSNRLYHLNLPINPSLLAEDSVHM